MPKIIIGATDTKRKDAIPRSAVVQKYCVRCDKLKPVSDFYKNAYWKEQSYHDAWCKDCVSKYVTDKETLKDYFAHNNRVYSDALFQEAKTRASYKLASSETYVRADEDKREAMLMKYTLSTVFSIMNQKTYYNYVNNMGVDGNFVPMSMDITTGSSLNDLTEADHQLVYSPEWCGRFERWQLERLDNLYARYSKEFNLTDVNVEDYARKACKASLNADIAEDKMRRGELSLKDYQDAQRVFDTYSLSSNFAASKRKQDDTSGIGSLGELIAIVEGTGRINKRQVSWPKDSVDRVLDHFRHTDIAVGEESST